MVMKETFERELAEYRGFSDEIRETLENNYQIAMYNNEIEDAYNAIGDMMAFKVIDTNDPRIQKNNKMFSAGGVDKDHRFRLDYRRDTGFIPEWIYGKIEPTRRIEIDSIEHWGKRVEGNYSGDTVFPSHTVQIRIAQCNTPKQAENTMEYIEKLFKKNGKNKKLTDMTTMVKEGVYRLFTIEVDSACISRYKTLGALLIKMGDNNITCSMLLDYDSIINNWIKIDTVVNEIKAAFNRMAKQECSFKVIFDTKVANESQNSIIKNSSVKPKTEG